MTKRIYWKKGMRLTDEILKTSDNCAFELISKSFALNAGGRFGLFPNGEDFNIIVDIKNNIIDILSINCFGITKDGTLIDIKFDTNNNNPHNSHIIIPNAGEDIKYIMCIKFDKRWIETNDGLCEPLYSFYLIEENTSVPNDSLPIAHILYDDLTWRLDDLNFVPPCLYISSLKKYKDLSDQFKTCLRKLDSTIPTNFLTEKKDAIKIFWPIVQQTLITIDKETDIMSPMELFCNIQKIISSFVCACTLDDGINLKDSDIFVAYTRNTYNYRDVYKKIQEGLELCSLIIDKVLKLSDDSIETKNFNIEAPYIDQNLLRQTIRSGNAKISIKNMTPGATIYYTLDGKKPTTSSLSGTDIIINSEFSNDWHKEPDKVVTIKVMAEKEGLISDIKTFEARIHKGNPFTGRKI